MKLYAPAAIVAAVLVAGLAGCSTSVTSTPAPTHHSTVVESTPKPVKTLDVTPSKAPLVTGEDAADAIFDASAGENLGTSDPSILKAARGVAHSFCTLLDSGTDFDTAATLTLSLAENQGVTAAQVGTIIGAGVPTYCPAYNDDLSAFVAEHE